MTSVKIFTIKAMMVFYVFFKFERVHGFLSRAKCLSHKSLYENAGVVILIFLCTLAQSYVLDYNSFNELPCMYMSTNSGDKSFISKIFP